jgi:hypothetical protein
MLTFINLGNMGRLGNQMFQIASTIGVAKKNNLEFSFPEWVCSHSGYRYEKFFKKSLPKKYFKNTIKIINECQFNYNEIIVDDKNLDYSLNGYYQTEKYFKEYTDVIKEYFELKNEYDDEINKKYGDILKNSCSIHIRRGDYLNQKDYHPVQSIYYYHEAIEKIYGNDTKSVNFLIFSDDIDWCKKNIFLPKIHFIENNINIIDMFLMSKCDNNIIANSSFSWWGAWLNKNVNKKVVGPTKWFGPQLSKHNTEDIIPNDWIKI